jgi:hypothetical protein
LFVAIVIACAPVAASAQPADDVESLSRLIDEGHADEAWNRLVQIVEREPDNLPMRYLASLAALETGRYDEARAHVNAGLDRSPDNATLLGLRSEIRFREGGDDIGARKDAKRALELDPDELRARFTDETLDVFYRADARRKGVIPALARDTPAGFVDHLFERGFAGAGALELATFIDLEILIAVPPERRTHAMLVGYLRDFLGGWAASHEGGYVGWLIGDTSTDGDRATVHVKMPIDIVLPESGIHQRGITTLDLELIETRDAFRITDAVLNGIDHRGKYGQVSTTPIAVRASHPLRSRPLLFEAGYRFGGPVLLIGVLVAVVLWLTGAAEKRRRRRRY